MVITRILRILFLCVSCCRYCPLMRTTVVLLHSQLLVILLVAPVGDAFITLPVRNRECHQTNDSGDDYNSRRCLFRRSNNAWLKVTSSTTRQRRATLLQRMATKQRTSLEEQKKSQETTTMANTIQIKYDKKWLHQFDDLKAFWDAYGHWKVPTSQRRLRTWVFTQRTVFRQGKMRPDRKTLLDKIGFVWDPHADSWERQYASLKSYKKENGHCNVPKRQGSLGPWVYGQRKGFREGQLSKERINLLEKIGFVWDRAEERWQNKYNELREFQQLHGHVNVPTGTRTLSEWTSKQRLVYAAGRLDPEKTAMLDDLGFVLEDPDFERHERQWLEMFRELVQYKLLEGHVRVPVGTSSLGHWVCQQRVLYRDGNLLEHREAKLESIGFIWRLKDYTGRDTTTWDKKWMTRYEELVEFQEEHGHSNVLVRDGALGTWVDCQRQVFRKDKIREDRKELLDEIGFEFEPMKVTRDEQWQAKYEELQSYKKEFGDLHVSATANLTLYKWINFQRKYQQAGRLESKRKAMLDKLGMEW